MTSQRATIAARRAARPLSTRYAAAAPVPSEADGPQVSVAALRELLAAAVPRALQELPYEQVTFSFMARLAGVAPADVRRCCSTKAEVVLAALRQPEPLPEGGALTGSGAEIVARWLEFWEFVDNVTILRSLCAAAASDRRLAAALEARVVAAAIAPFAARVSAPDACPRARLACAQLIGLAASRYVLRQEPLASADHQTIAAWAGPALDCVLGGELGRPL